MRLPKTARKNHIVAFALTLFMAAGVMPKNLHAQTTQNTTQKPVAKKTAIAKKTTSTASKSKKPVVHKTVHTQKKTSTLMGIDPAFADKSVKPGKVNTFNYVEQMPSPPYDLNKFIGENLQYPAYARENNIEGRVIVKFVVDTLGNIIEPEVERSPDTSLSRAALAVISQMPRWKPGKQNGQKVMVYFTQPLSFKLE